MSVLGERLPIKIYTSADGLGSSASFRLIRDPRGFIWLCSRDGLVRFDGQRFITYKIGDDLADPAVFNLIPTQKGDYWIDLNRGTDYRFVPPSDDTILEVRNGIPDADVRIPINAQPVKNIPLPSFEDHDGNLWTANGQGLYLLTEQDGQFGSTLFEMVRPGSPENPLTSVDLRKSNRGDGFWIGTSSGLIRRFRSGKSFHISIKPTGDDDSVRTFAEDTYGRVWIARPEGIIILNAAVNESGVAGDIRAAVTTGVLAADETPSMPVAPGDAVEFSFRDLLSRRQGNSDGQFSNPTINEVIVASDGKVWMATTHGLILYDGRRFRHFTTENGLATNEIGSLVEGTDGDIWIATYGGLHRLNLNAITTFDESDGLERTRIHNMFENSTGVMQIISGNFNISSFEGGRFRMSHPSIPDDEVFTWQSTAGFLDSRGEGWFYTNKALHRFFGVTSARDLDGRTPDASYNEANGGIGGNVIKAFEDSGGNLWFSSYSALESRGVSRFDRNTNLFQTYSTKDGLPQLPVAAGFVEDASGDIWIGFVEGEILRYRDGKFAPLESDTAPVAGITSLFRDSRNRIWVATGREGLFVADDPTQANPVFRRFTIANGLASNNIRCITEDVLGNIYVGTVRGVDRLSPDFERTRYYGTADGLASDFVHSAFRDRHGDVWFGTLNGLSRLTPIADNASLSPEILISGVQIAGEDLAVSPLGQRKVILANQEPGAGNIQIDFLSIKSAGSSTLKYQYRFEDSSNDWNAPSAESTVNFANLGPGSYRFLVRSVNADGQVSDSPATVSFTILRPIWQRWWFLLLTAVAISTIFYFIYRYRVAQLLKLERIRTRIASDLHDDIGSSLSQISILSEVAKQRSVDKEVAEPLAVIAETSREMVDSMSDIVWAIDPKKDSVGDLVQRMRRFAEDTLDANNIAYKFSFDDSLSTAKIGVDIRREIYLIFKETINNLTKHARAQRASISIGKLNENLRIDVEDDGVGFDANRQEEPDAFSFGGNGIPNMRKRAEAIGGSLTIAKAEPSGTVVSLRLPVKL